MKYFTAIILMILVASIGALFWVLDSTSKRTDRRIGDLEDDLSQLRQQSYSRQTASSVSAFVRERHRREDQPAGAGWETIRDLRLEFKDLVQRIDRIESALSERMADPTPGPSSRIEDSSLARSRYRRAEERDKTRYTGEEMMEISEIYRRLKGETDVENRSRASKELIDRFPDSNRAGCAAYDMGQQMFEEGDLDQAGNYLDFIIHNNHPGVFRNGVNVMPLTLNLQAELWEARGEPDLAMYARQRLIDEYPDDFDMHGNNIADMAQKHLTNSGR